MKRSQIDAAYARRQAKDSAHYAAAIAKGKSGAAAKYAADQAKTDAWYAHELAKATTKPAKAK